jgi:hypothetical protein
MLPNTDIVVFAGILPVPVVDPEAVPTKRKYAVAPDLTVIGFAIKAAVKVPVISLVWLPTPVIEAICVAERKSAVLL